MNGTQQDEEKEIFIDHTQKISPPKWQTIRLENGIGGNFFPHNQRSSPTRSTNIIQPMTNQARIKNSLKGTMNSVIRPRQEESKINGQDDVEADFFRKAFKLNVTLDKNDMDLISFNVSIYFNDYQEKEIIGEGCIGLVKRLVELRTGDKYAVKQVSTNDEEIVTNEFKRLVQLQHPNIVKMHRLFVDYKDGFQDQSKIYVIMELVEGKEMFQYIQELGHYSEEITKHLFRQLLSGIHFLHNNGICHRDLKPNNLLCSEKCDLLKITDFNVSKFSENYKGFFDIEECDQIEMWTYTGTVAFSAPEIFVGYGYNEKVDLWSAGCILFTMLCGVMPFQQEYLNDLIDLICSGQFTFLPEKWHYISKEAQDLIINLLRVDQDQRYSAEQALNHQWFQDKKEPTNSIKRSDLNKNISRLTRKNERKNKKQRTNLILFGAKHLYHQAKSSEDVFYFHPFDRKKKSFVRSAEIRRDYNFFDIDIIQVEIQTPIEMKQDHSRKYYRNRFALSHQSPQKAIDPNSQEKEAINNDDNQFG